MIERRYHASFRSIMLLNVLLMGVAVMAAAFGAWGPSLIFVCADLLINFFILRISLHISGAKVTLSTPVKTESFTLGDVTKLDVRQAAFGLAPPISCVAILKGGRKVIVPLRYFTGFQDEIIDVLRSCVTERY